MDLNKIEIYSLDVSFKITKSMTMPIYTGFKIYGILGNAFRSIFCWNKELDNCSKCQKKYNCWVTKIYKCIREDVSVLPIRYQKYSNLPAKFSILPSQEKKRNYTRQDPFIVRFNFMGPIADEFPIIIIALENMRKFKPDRDSNGSLRLQTIINKSNHKIVYENAKFSPENLNKHPLDNWKEMDDRTYDLEMITPTRITHNGKHIMDEINGEILAQRIWERAMLMILLHSDQKEIPELKKNAIEIISKELVWKEYQHRSSRQNFERNKYGGFVGQMKININDPTIIPFLKLLEFMHLGSNAKAGFGKYKIKAE